MIKKISVILLLSLSLEVQAKFVSNGFLVNEKKLDFSKTIRSGECEGVISYPLLSNGDEELIIEINDEIHDFAELYGICNQGRREHFSVNFDIPESRTKEYFSIRWITKRNDKIWRIDVLNFDRDTGRILSVHDVFNIMSNNLMGELIKLSEGYLNRSCRWEDFVDKVEKRDIQLYIKQKKWFIVFNATQNRSDLIDVELPKYFLKGGDHDRG